MAAQVKILIEGFTNADSVAETGQEKTQPTITLVRDGGLTMVVDPGLLESQEALLAALNKEGLEPNDVNTVFLTHSHIDHYRNVGMFPNAKVIEYYGVWEKLSVKEWQENFTENIKIIHTPGHDISAISLLVSSEKGSICICGDVFWSENHPETPEDDVFASNPGKLKESRDVVLRMADWIIPGHGPMYKSNGPVPERAGYESILPKAKPSLTCKNCGRQISTQTEKCKCRPYLCFHCCMCGLDCDGCSCSHKARRI